MNIYAVIPSGNRLDELTELVKSLTKDKIHVVVVDTGYERLSPPITGSAYVRVQNGRTPEKNISCWWNIGIEAAEEWEKERTHGEALEFFVAILNDDVVIHDDTIRKLADAIVQHDVQLAYPNVWGLKQDEVFERPTPFRMSGYCFMLRGLSQFRADEDLKWWGGDTDLEWQALRSGGTVLVADTHIHHLYPNSTTVGKLAEQAGRDRETFRRKWGVYGW